jgi:predicted outer membrane protein
MTQEGVVTHPQIAAIVVAAYNVDIESGRLAQGRATNPEIREFAQRMVADHTTARPAGEIRGQIQRQ